MDDREDRLELIRVGGKQQVPCLFIDVKPMYESLDIVEWLRDYKRKLKADYRKMFNGMAGDCIHN